MQLQDLISWIFHHTTLRTSSSSTISGVPGRKVLAKRGVSCIVGSCGSSFTPPLCFAILSAPIGFDPQEDDAKLCEFSRRVLKMVHLEQEDLQKRVLRYPLNSMYQAASENRG